MECIPVRQKNPYKRTTDHARNRSKAQPCPAHGMQERRIPPHVRVARNSHMKRPQTMLATKAEPSPAPAHGTEECFTVSYMPMSPKFMQIARTCPQKVRYRRVPCVHPSRADPCQVKQKSCLLHLIYTISAVLSSKEVMTHRVWKCAYC